MKKGLLIMASALVGLSAIAAPKVAQKGTALMKVAGNDITLSQPVNINKKAALKPSSRNDLLGFYAVPFGQWMFTNENPYGDESNAVLKAGDTESEILINGLFMYQPFSIVMTVDMAKGEAVIREQMLGFATAANANMKIEVMQANMETQKWEDVSEIVGTIEDDGRIVFEKGCIMLMNADKEGYGWGGFGSFYFEPTDYYNVDLKEWTAVGSCIYEEGWISPILGERAPNQTLKVYKNNKENGVFAFENPYASEIWSEINTPPAGQTNKGWIVVDASNEDCVCARTLVASGLWLQVSDDDYQQMYLFNQEGYKFYRQDIWPDEQIDEYLAIGEDPNEYLSYKAGNVITLRNLLFGQTDNPLGSYEWVDDDGKSAMIYNSVFTLSLDGVEDIVVDANAPVKYYNLQGMQVVNPAEGQVVIKTQGNKAEKVVF